MRIACIASSEVPSRKANSIRVMKVTQSLVDLGHTIRLWLPGRTPRVSWEFLTEHYGIQGSFPIRWLWEIRPLRRYDFCFRAVLSARLWNADLFYVWPLQAAAFSSRIGFPTLLDLHDQPMGRFGPWLFHQSMHGPGMRRLITTTEALRAWLGETFQIELGPPLAQVAPNGVDLERFENLPNPYQAQEALGLPAAFSVGYTGHLYSGRGIELLVELARRNRDIRFIWAGGEPSAVEDWRARLAELGLNNIVVLGFVPNERLPFIHAACEILLMPYERQIAVSSGGDSARFASPMKVFEYLAAERAIISSDLPVLREILNEGNALLVPPEDVEAWNIALQALVADTSRRKILAAQARADATGYTWIDRARRTLEGLEIGDAS